MSASADTEALLKSFRKKPLFDAASLPVRLEYGQADIGRIIPHRPPVLFVDRLTGLDLDQGLMSGERTLRADDPVFSGHFPDFPVYPGNFTVESIGQLGLCLYYFVANARGDIAPDARPLSLRATKIAGSLFIEPIRPGDTITMLVRRHTWDGYFASLIGQALVNGKVAVVTMGEVMILED